MKKHDIVIIGGGPAGMAAALGALKSGIEDILLLERDWSLGGILNQCVHTGFGLHYFKETLTGPEYAQRFTVQVYSQKSIRIVTDSHAVALTPEKVVTFINRNGLFQVKAQAVIMASGCREKTRQMVHIPGTRPAGVYSAGLAQKLINIEGMLPGKEAVIIGSGDIGLIMARRLSLEGVRVKAMIEVLEKSRGLARNLQCLDDFSIPAYYRHKVSEIRGRDRVESVEVVALDGESHPCSAPFTIECDTVLLSVGLIPENELLEMAGARIDPENNTPVTDKVNFTSLPGIFACGNCARIFDLADSVTEDGFRAGVLAAGHIKKQ